MVNLYLACQDHNIYKLKKNYNSKKILKTNGNITSNYYNIGNAKNTSIHFPELND